MTKLVYWLLAAAVALLPFNAGQAAEQQRLPNLVIILADDMGYSDAGCYGGRIKTPNLDRMAKEGIRFTDFHVAQPVCSASRTGLLTGCYPNRLGIHGALNPFDKHGISDKEMTLAQLVKQRGYATAIYGKWHLGHLPPFLPTRHGFDEYFGLPYSNDMKPKPDTKPGTYPELPLMENEKTVKLQPDQSQLTTWYTDHAVQFIEKNKEKPFFLYVPYAMPHVPLAVSDKFKGKSELGLYGDVIMEIDWSVGEILAAVKKNGLDDNTLVMFLSDNGPWLSYGNHGGSATPLREGKGTSFEGGTREPFIARWPGKIPAGSVCKEMAMTIDLFPTIAKLIDAKLPEHKIDGLDIWPLLSGDPKAKNPHECYYFYYGVNELQAVRSGQWKLYLPHTSRTLGGAKGGEDGKPAAYKPLKVGLELYDLDADLSETTNVADKHPDVVKRLQALAEQAREDMGDSLTKRVGKGTRQPGRVQDR
jgi:arylsulfatase A